MSAEKGVLPEPLSFRRMLREDVDAVFLNTAEFAEPAELAGHMDVPCVVEPLELELGDAGRGAVSYEGVTIFVAADRMPDILLPGRTTTFRGERWQVLNADCGDALRIIRLYRERT